MKPTKGFVMSHLRNTTSFVVRNRRFIARTIVTGAVVWTVCNVIDSKLDAAQ